ncbi:MAG: DUF2029 domain-containing protein [Lachnospiraceae bacterium]|nr:DUF2029 domain-containing protein [Lachnospiraceae bacterium]
MKRKTEPIDLFLMISFAGTVLFLLMMMIGKGFGAEWVVMENNFDNTFTDHFRHIAFASDMEHFYFNTNDATFPPFAYLLYYLLYRINPRSWAVNEWKAARDHTYNIVVLTALFLLVVILYRYACDKILDSYSSGMRTLFTIATVFSAPVLAGAIERGNISFLTAILVIFALYLKDSDNKYLKELALILIAFSAGIKLYPAIVGLIYIREKRYKEAVRLVVYGLIVFFVPFAFCGGIPALIQYLKILFFFEGQGYRSWTNIRNYLLSVSDLFGLYERSAYFVKYFKIAENLFLLFCIVSVFKAKRFWKQVLYLAGIMALYVPYSYRYTAVYMLIPLFFYLRDNKGVLSTFGNIYPILFALTFTFPVWGMLTPLGADFFIFTPIYLLMIISFIEDWCIKSKS